MFETSDLKTYTTRLSCYSLREHADCKETATLHLELHEYLWLPVFSEIGHNYTCENLNERDACGMPRRGIAHQRNLRGHADAAEQLYVGAKYYTPEITKVNFRWKMQLNIHWTIPVKIHWKSDNALEHTNETWNVVGKWHWQFIGKCHWKSTMISEVLISGVQSLPLVWHPERFNLTERIWSLAPLASTLA